MARIVRETRTAKRTYTIDEATIEQFESQVPSGQRSEVVERLIRTELEERAREQLRSEVVEGLKEMAHVIEELASEWSAADDERWPTP